MSTISAGTRPGTPERIKVAGMAADMYGTPDGRPPLLLLPGLSFDRGVWQPVLDRLVRLDPRRQILSLDLPGHGESPDQLPHSMTHLVALIHEAVTEAGLDAPVVVGHSISGGFASIYAGQFATRGVVNVDALPDIESFVRLLQSAEGSIRGDGFPSVWPTIEEAMFRLDLLPAVARAVVARTSDPRQDLVVSYWDEILSQPVDQQTARIAEGISAVARASVPYLLVAGTEPPPDVAETLHAALPLLEIEVWADTGHFPHLAHPDRFAALLAATAGWQRKPDGQQMTPPEMDRVIDAHFDAERRGDLEAILETVAERISHETFGSGLTRPQGKDAVRTFYELLSRELSIDSYTTVRRLYGPNLVWEEGVVQATAKGQPFGLDGNGRRISYQLLHLFEFRDGLIAREFGIPDVASISAQLPSAG
jgi:pimeloyl-ACP methyl ester carboxylesterase/predicted ester cyclase